MKKFIILLIITIAMIVGIENADAASGYIFGASADKVLIATIDQSYEIEIASDGSYTVDEDKEFTVFVPISKGESFSGSEWFSTDNSDYAWITVGNNTDIIPEISFIKGSTGAVAVSAFQDDNLNGVRGKYELPIEGVDFEIIDSNENVFARGRTNEQEVIIDNIPVGEYFVRFKSGTDYFFTNSDNPQINSQFSSTNGSFDSFADSPVFNIEEGKTIYITSGMFFVSSMEGQIWLDENNNGIMDDGEASFTNLSIVAHSKTNNSDYEANIDENGYWRLDKIPYGEYELRAQLPDGYLFAPYSLEGRELRSIFTEYIKNYGIRIYKLGKGQSLKNMNIGVIKPASVELSVFMDSNYNSIIDDDEYGVQGVTIELIRDNLNKVVAKAVSDENGKVYFPAIRENDYRIRAILPSQDLQFSKVGAGDIANTNYFAQDKNRKDSNVYNINLLNNRENHIAVGIADMIDFGGRVYLDKNANGSHDKGEKPLANVEVRAYSENNELLYTTKSNAKGEYRIEGLFTGKVRLEFKAIKDHMFVVSHGDISNFLIRMDETKAYTDYFELSMGEDITDIDAGLIPRAKITGLVFEDLNDNGLNDDDKGFEGIQIELLDSEENTLLTTYSDANGKYVFDGVIPGVYYLRYTINGDAEFAEYNSAGNLFDSKESVYTSERFKFNMGESIVANLGGAVRIAHIDIGVFADSDANGVFDNEEFIKNVKINLSSSNSKQENIAITVDTNNTILNLRPGLINLNIEFPAEYIFSRNTYGLSCKNKSLSIAQINLLDNPSIYIGAIKPADINTSAWLDENMDSKIGKEDKAYKNAKFLLIDSEGTADKYIADDEGNLHINDIIAGNYRLALLLDKSSSAVGGLSSEDYAGFTIAYRDILVKEGSSVDIEPFAAQVLMKISGRLYIDENSLQKPISEHKLSLYNGSKLVAETISDSDGRYSFENLRPGKYNIQLESFNNGIFARPGDDSFSTNSIGEILDNGAKSIDLKLTMPESLENIDFIAIVPAKIGDIAWIDINGNGLQDIDEPTLSNISIELEQKGESVYSTTSDGNGFYILDNIYPGEYRIKANIPDGLAIASVYIDIPEINSALTEQDGDIAYSDIFSIKSGEKKYNMDLGFVLLEGYEADQFKNNPSTQDWSKQTSNTNEGWSR